MTAAQQWPTGLLTVEDVAAILKVVPKTIYRLIERREIAVVAIGRVFRITWDDLYDFLRRAKQKVANAPRKSY